MRETITVLALVPALGWTLQGCGQSAGDDDAPGVQGGDDDAALGDDDAADDSIGDWDEGEPPLDEDPDEPTCEDAPPEAETWFMSADDSNSQGQPVVFREAIFSGLTVSSTTRPYEFLNYAEFDFEPAGNGRVAIVPQLRAVPDDPGAYSMLIAVVGPHVDPEARRPISLTFSVDSSGSMSGQGIQRSQEAIRAMAGSLLEGDVVSLLTWATTSTVLLDSHSVGGPNDPVLLDAVDSLSSGGSTDLHGGLVRAYEIAMGNDSPGRINRVVLVSDGGANVGITDADLIGKAAEDVEQDGIYLMGIGAASSPSSYQEGLMDTVTDLGKGAYLYVDSAAEAERVLSGERFVANVEVAARDVRLSMTLPAGFLIEEFHGEELSKDPAEVRPQHLAPNDAMLYHQVVRDCAAGARDGGDAFSFVVEWEDPVTREAHTETLETSLDELTAAATEQLVKADAIVAYAQSLTSVWDVDASERVAYLEGVLAEVEEALLVLPLDRDLREAADVLAIFVSRF
ncbi:VWA domain-containing protein [Myxococcota bacterium]|nr:VWA domain-containing protein [Myxococcota bacterium]